MVPKAGLEPASAFHYSFLKDPCGASALLVYTLNILYQIKF